jgi:Transglycosylase SLT domain
MDTSLRVAYAPEIAAAAARHHLDPRLLAAVAAQETGGPGSDSGRNVVGDGGHGRGLFQVDDRWHAFARSPGAMDPAQNADYAAGMIAGNLRRYGGDVRAALSAYNAGSPGATGTRTDWGDGKPVGYAESVLRHFSRLGGGGAPAQQPAAAGGADARDAAERVDGLRGALWSLGGAGAGASGIAGTPAGDPSSAAAGAVFGMQLSLPQRQPLARINEHDRSDLAPSAAGDPGTDDGSADPSGATTTA